MQTTEAAQAAEEQQTYAENAQTQGGRWFRIQQHRRCNIILLYSREIHFEASVIRCMERMIWYLQSVHGMELRMQTVYFMDKGFYFKQNNGILKDNKPT